MIQHKLGSIPRPYVKEDPIRPAPRTCAKSISALFAAHLTVVNARLRLEEDAT